MNLFIKLEKKIHLNDDFIHETMHERWSTNHDRCFSHKKMIFFSPDEIKNVIPRLPNKKVSGQDKVSNYALKHVNNKFILNICQNFNGCTRQEYFLTWRKKAEIMMIPKPGKNPKLPINHHPISLLNMMSKVLEQLLLNLKSP